MGLVLYELFPLEIVMKILLEVRQKGEDEE
ncbi:MAG: hypothetical protein UT63_C0046G0008 [Candidatus Gottesmanbacteria bacterium GW2011_GWC2_39_8]|uniref:Uncharacterized protein n=1 Tax=Candidatus Gottesmanbacteria bacterium GW2011_GWC2_39_8 TaxID=1618450 RepID=A0A0G0PWQ9_9BACT|nr:MAG: hypothetical protein UT63_C0046G0008 [Candidatus Gottesmanbacteria bacterium GW2011_GWC2_39_8]